MIAAPEGVYAFFRAGDEGFVAEKVIAFSEVGGNSPVRPALVMSEEGELVSVRDRKNFSHMGWDAMPGGRMVVRYPSGHDRS